MNKSFKIKVFASKKYTANFSLHYSRCLAVAIRYVQLLKA